MTETLVDKINPKTLPVGAELELHTRNSIYTLRVDENGMTIQGGKYFHEPVRYLYQYSSKIPTGEDGPTMDEVAVGGCMIGVARYDENKNMTIGTSAISKIILRGPSDE